MLIPMAPASSRSTSSTVRGRSSFTSLERNMNLPLPMAAPTSLSANPSNSL